VTGPSLTDTGRDGMGTRSGMIMSRMTEQGPEKSTRASPLPRLQHPLWTNLPIVKLWSKLRIPPPRLLTSILLPFVPALPLQPVLLKTPPIPRHLQPLLHSSIDPSSNRHLLVSLQLRRRMTRPQQQRQKPLNGSSELTSRRLEGSCCFSGVSLLIIKLILDLSRLNGLAG
jgi:hypothetical protein